MISKNAIIEADHVQIGKNVVIGDGVEIRCKDRVFIGDNSVLTKDIKINCTSFEAGEYLYMTDRCEVGRGGCYGPNSKVKIGNYVGIFEGTVINPSESVEIGDHTGIGGDVMIWTHGAWLDVLQGFPAEFGSVKIGKNVWLPARSIVLPNVTIGDNSVIGINSIINRSLPEGCFAAGSPCKVIKENVYPKKLSEKERSGIVNNILEDWLINCKMKKISKNLDVKYKSGKIILWQNLPMTVQQKNAKLLAKVKIKNEEDKNLDEYLDKRNIKTRYETIFDLDNRTISGYNNNIVQDLRDYLRRRGIKIYTGELFRSI